MVETGERNINNSKYEKFHELSDSIKNLELDYPNIILFFS